MPLTEAERAERDEKIRAFRSAGESQQKIAIRLGCSVPTVQRALAGYRAEMPKPIEYKADLELATATLYFADTTAMRVGMNVIAGALDAKKIQFKQQRAG